MANNDTDIEEFLQHQYPLHLACFRGDEAYLKDLLMSGQADIYQEDSLHGWTPMHWAAHRGKWKCLELVGHICRVDLDVTNTRFNQTPAHIAAQQSQAECIAWLVQHGISLGIQDHMGNTPLHKAAQRGHLECVKLLTMHGPILSTFNYNGQTPLDIATRNEHHQCKAFLEQAVSSQHSSFFPSTSSPILMNGEGIYQNDFSGQDHSQCDQDMEMGEEMGSDGDAGGMAQPPTGCKRSFDDEEETPSKRQRLYAPNITDKLGTVTNNNVLSSYQGILAMSVEPLKPPTSHHLSDTQEVHVMPTPSPAAWNPSSVVSYSTSSVVDHCNAMFAQQGYDSLMMDSVIQLDHGC